MNLSKKPVFKKRWLNGDLKPDDPANQQPVFLVSTSAGEVGFDLNADHMVCDATTIDSFIQRLGRVNRRGLGDATVCSSSNQPEEGQGRQAEEAGRATIAPSPTRSNCSRRHGRQPEEHRRIKDRANGKISMPHACSPEPTTVELTDILLDAWSMTSITEPMPGRPEVGPWLRGIEEELPQTTIAWRAELDLNGFADLDLDEIEEWFDTHRVLTHETLSVPDQRCCQVVYGTLGQAFERATAEIDNAAGHRRSRRD